MIEGSAKMDFRVDGRTRCILCVALLSALCGCRSTRSAISKTPSVPPQAPVLAPMPDYPEERTGWDTNAVVGILESPTDPKSHTHYGEVLRKALRQRGYRVVDGFDSLKARRPPYVDTDWLAAEWRRQSKLLIITGTRAWGSVLFEGKISSDYCMQVLVFDHHYDGYNLALAVPNIRTFHVWSRASFSQGATWDDAYPVHGLLLVENLMRMPGFRAALERTPSALAVSLCPKPPRPAVTVPGQTVADAVPTVAAASSGDREISERLIGIWEERIIAHVKTIEGDRARDTSTSETTSKTVYRTDGRFSREVRMGDAAPKTFEGTWRIRNGRLYTETAAEATGRKWAVPCEYELVWNGKDAVVFRMTPDGYQGMLKSGGGDALGHCWYEPADVLHTTITMGGFTVESESKVESAKRGNP